MGFDENKTTKLRDRVFAGAEAVLKTKGSVGPLELFQEMGLLQPVHFDAWRRGNEYYRVLEDWIQVGQKKFDQALRYFGEWARERGLFPIEVSYTRRTPGGIEQLQVTADGNPEDEKFYRTHYAPTELTEPQRNRLAGKLEKPPDLVVFEKVTPEGNCSECGSELHKGTFLFMEKGQPLCLACADLDHLEFLPAGDAALSRRARKYSVLSAVVVRFSRARKRYERQGLLVTSAALARAEEECAADAPEREVRRARAALARQTEDREFVQSLMEAILRQYPGCPPDEARAVAAHAAERGSGRIGRTATGRALDPRAIQLTVLAHIRHEHTKYDELLMHGTERIDARALVREQIDRVVANWSKSRATT